MTVRELVKQLQELGEAASGRGDDIGDLPVIFFDAGGEDTETVVETVQMGHRYAFARCRQTGSQALVLSTARYADYNRERL